MRDKALQALVLIGVAETRANEILTKYNDQWLTNILEEGKSDYEFVARYLLLRERDWDQIEDQVEKAQMLIDRWKFLMIAKDLQDLHGDGYLILRLYNGEEYRVYKTDEPILIQ